MGLLREKKTKKVQRGCHLHGFVSEERSPTCPVLIALLSLNLWMDGGWRDGLFL